jgi:hypothetical protein
MFEIGRTYRITLVGGGPEDSFKGTLLRYDFPLISIEVGEGERIVNLNSPSFVRADRHDAETLAAKHVRQDDLGTRDGLTEHSGSPA